MAKKNMFTGIITDIGTITSLTPRNEGIDLSITCGGDMRNVALGASIACDGVCLTVTDKGGAHFDAHIGAETLALTTARSWKKGSQLNLERALKVGDELGGHMVSGHVDGLCELVEVRQDGDSWRLTLNAPKSLAAYISPKGSVTLNGISLTVNEVRGEHFGVCIIPHTWEHTTLRHKQCGDQINLEVDRLAMQIERILEYRGFTNPVA